MERNIVVGKRVQSLEFRGQSLIFGKLNREDLRNDDQGQSGFSLLELLIAMFIIVILLSVAFPTYQRSIQHARENVLKQNIYQMESAVQQYTTDKQKAPQSLQDLVEAKYLKEIPIDPITEKKEWNEVKGTDPNSAEGEQGLTDIKSLADGNDSGGVPYKDY